MLIVIQTQAYLHQVFRICGHGLRKEACNSRGPAIQIVRTDCSVASVALPIFTPPSWFTRTLEQVRSSWTSWWDSSNHLANDRCDMMLAGVPRRCNDLKEGNHHENFEAAYEIAVWDLTEHRELGFGAWTRESFDHGQSIGRTSPLRHSDRPTQLNLIVLIIGIPR